ncbi:MAG: TetR/AcrR family transcriptional regulator [Streptosporangiaceae bacterium]
MDLEVAAAESEWPGGPARERPLRRDAERNRQAILRAAADVIGEHGLEASLDDVARRAGVGIGTVYRRFPCKEALTEALFADRLDALVVVAEQSLADPDPGAGLYRFLEGAAELLVADRGLRQILMFAPFGHDQACQAREKLQPVVAKLIVAAQAAGLVRADLQPTDIPPIMQMLAAAADYARPVRPDGWRRYLRLLLDALAPSRGEPTVLPEPALTPDELQAAMRARRSSCRG